MDLDKQEICIRSDIIKRFINRSVEKERYLFLAMCSNQDADRVLGKLKMETKDFERLSFLISQLGFYSLGMSFDMIGNWSAAMSGAYMFGSDYSNVAANLSLQYNF